MNFHNMSQPLDKFTSTQVYKCTSEQANKYASTKVQITRVHIQKCT